MTVSHAHRLATLVFALMLAACQREAAPAADTAEPQPEAAAAQTPIAPEAATSGTDAIETVDNGPLDLQAQSVGGVDVRAFAGIFSTEGARIEFKPDGTYAMTVHAASADADLKSSGTWNAQADGNEVMLDPDDKSESDHSYIVVSNNEIWEVDGGGRVLRREGSK